MSERPFDDTARALTTEWLKQWAALGPELEARRTAELRALTETESARIAVDIIWPMVPPSHGDDGEGLRTFKDVMRRIAMRQ